MISEKTPLVGTSSLRPYTPSQISWLRSGEDVGLRATDVREDGVTGFYGSVFSAAGITITVRDVAVVQRSLLHHCFASVYKGRICCQTATACFCAGKLHLVADVDGIAGGALLDGIVGRTACASGEISIDAVVTEPHDRIPLIAAVGLANFFVPRLSVEDHLSYAVYLNRRGLRSWMKEVVQAAANFTRLDPQRKVEKLTTVEKFRLQVAVELVRDPPALCFSYPFLAMNLAQQIECVELLQRITDVLHKTVVVCTRALPMNLFSTAATLLLFGAGGLVLYSGPCTGAIPYFNRLRISRHVPEPLWKMMALPPADTPMEEEENGIYGSQVQLLRAATPPLSTTPKPNAGGEAGSRLYLALCTPPRLSSRLLSADAHDAFAPFITTPAPSPAAEEDGAVEVATSGDLVDLAEEWAAYETETMYYAAKFYDSAAHRALLSLLDRGVRAPSRSRPVEVTMARPVSPNSLWRFSMLLSFSLKQITADAELVAGVVFLSAGLVVLALIVHSQPEDQGGMYNIRGLVFMAFTLILFTNLVTMDSAREQLRVAVVHRKRHLYDTWSFTVCLAIRIVLIRSVYVALFFPFVFFVLQSSYALALLAWMVSCTHAVFHYMTAAMLPSRWSTTWAWYAAFGYNIIFSGFLLNLCTIPPALARFSFLRWGYGAMLHTWLHGRSFRCDGANNTSYCYTGDDYLTQQGFESDSVVSAVLILFVSGLAMLVVLAVVVRISTL